MRFWQAKPPAITNATRAKQLQGRGVVSDWVCRSHIFAHESCIFSGLGWSEDVTPDALL
jgi:hypothetical protein